MNAIVVLTCCPELGCGLPASAVRGTWLRSTHGPVEHASTMCPRGHWFFGPADSLITPTTGWRRAAHSPADRPARKDLHNDVQRPAHP